MSSQNRNRATFQPLPAAAYYASVPIIYFLSVLPFRLLYAFSDFVYFILYYLVGYRKDVVLQNLRNSFPEKTEAEIGRICRDFYHHLVDFMLEIIKALTISKKSIQKRCKLSPEAAALFAKFADANKSVIMVMGHLGNWEWACNAFNALARQQLFVIYHPITNKYFDGLMHRIRNRTGTKLIPMKNTYREMAVNKNVVSATAFVADQTPRPEHAYWMKFLNQDTPVFKGVEVIAKKMGMPVIYTSVKKVKRGYYEMNAELLIENPANTTDGEICEAYIKRLEHDIKDQPETWLWTHRRWKHKRPNLYKDREILG